MEFDDLARRLTDEYSLFLLALTGSYQQVRSPGVEMTPKAIADIQFAGYQLAQTFYSIAEARIDDYARPLLEEASAELGSMLLTRKNALKDQLRVMLLENVQTVARQARGGSSNVASLLKGTTGAIGMLMQRMAGKIEFKATDTAGRKWDAEKLMRVVVREFAYKAWLDCAAEQYLFAGHDLMQTTKGDIFSLRGAKGYPTYGHLRGTAFHINSNQIMVPYVPS